RHQSVTTLLSGPVGGIVGAQQIGGLIGESNIITTDMGGTSFDVGLVVGGQPIRSAQTVIHRHILTVPAVDIETIGAGGGSAVWLDDNGNIKVGPRSVGSNPGPACYGLGGLDPTVTDADVVLGFIDTSSFAFAHGRASRDYAVAAIEERIGRPLGLSAEEAAHGVLQIVNNQMADLIRKVTIEKGHDPGDFVLLAYGGSGPAHCTA
ncbi:hydantoinase/oxoprolinase family protein, partial [Hwanghaeella sp. LZ110]